MSHTPGPWVWEHHAATPETIAVSSLKGPTVLCRFWPILATANLDDDARLIAAAPDLLAALEDCMETYKSVMQSEFETHRNRNPHVTTQWNKWASIVRAAKGEL